MKQKLKALVYKSFYKIKSSFSFQEARLSKWKSVLGKGSKSQQKIHSFGGAPQWVSGAVHWVSGAVHRVVVYSGNLNWRNTHNRRGALGLRCDAQSCQARFTPKLPQIPKIAQLFQRASKLRSLPFQRRSFSYNLWWLCKRKIKPYFLAISQETISQGLHWSFQLPSSFFHSIFTLLHSFSQPIPHSLTPIFPKLIYPYPQFPFSQILTINPQTLMVILKA